jgi:hypothetical protein
LACCPASWSRRPRSRCRIGDPAVFLGVYDAAVEEAEISKAFERGTVDALERRMEANAEPYLKLVAVLHRDSS